jgi:hypothetical protein
MASNVTAATTRRGQSLLARLRQRRRTVRVDVLTLGLLADSLDATRPATLRPAIRSLYAHLPWDGTLVRFTGVEEETLPLGLRRRRREAALPGSRAALAFLGDVDAAAWHEKLGRVAPQHWLAVDDPAQLWIALHLEPWEAHASGFGGVRRRVWLSRRCSPR